MPRRSRPLQRLLKEQDTVGARRAERKEQEELAGKKKVAAVLAKSLRGEEFEDDTTHGHAPSPRVARVGKPLKRPKT